MGIGWIVQTNSGETKAEFKAGTKLIPSSTRAELIVILSVISTINFNKTINIITDSQLSINAIYNCYNISNNKNNHTTYPKTTKFNKQKHNPNSLLTKTIIELLTIKKINWTLTKIKG